MTKEPEKTAEQEKPYTPHGWAVNNAANRSFYEAGIDTSKPSRFAQECARKKEEEAKAGPAPSPMG